MGPFSSCDTCLEGANEEAAQITDVRQRPALPWSKFVVEAPKKKLEELKRLLPGAETFVLGGVDYESAAVWGPPQFRKC